MPAHKMHLAIALEINRYLNLNNDLIMMGSVLPDLTISNSHRQSHCRNNQNGLQGLANPKLFIKKYREDICNPIMLGYLIHLLTDEFFNKYLYKNYYVYDNNNNTIGVKIKNHIKYFDKDIIKKMKHKDFKLYDKYLLYKNKIIKFKDKKCYKLVRNIDIAEFDENKLKRYIRYANNEINIFNRINPKIDSKLQILNINELNEQYIKCCKHIINFINRYNLNKGGFYFDY